MDSILSNLEEVSPPGTAAVLRACLDMAQFAWMLSSYDLFVMHACMLELTIFKAAEQIAVRQLIHNLLPARGF
jgi:hypothetical protein